MEHIRTLIADDSAPVREGLRAILETEGDFTIVGEAIDGEEAVRKARELDPDVVLMDYSMPVVDGIEATLRIKHSQPDAAVVSLPRIQVYRTKPLRAAPPDLSSRAPPSKTS